MVRKSKIRNLLEVIWKCLMTTFKHLWMAFILYMLFKMFHYFEINDLEKALLNAIGAFSGMTFLLGVSDD